MTRAENKKLRIVYMGTPDFAVAPLQALIQAGYNIVGVVTNPDKPAGRGQKIKESAVKRFARQQNFKILQPDKFRNPEFLSALSELKADLQIVVAFKILPEVVWNMPRFGTVNLHASLLPHYRGAAPINWAVINGETETGVSTFLLQNKVDTGNIIFQEKININETDNAGDIHNQLMEIGAQLVVKTVKAIETGNFPQIIQNSVTDPSIQIKTAPRIFKEDCKINWKKDIEDIYNLIRGLSPYPAAWTEMEPVKGNGGKIPIKIYSVEKEKKEHNEIAGKLISDGRKYLKIAVPGGFISILSLQQAGKNRMSIEEFLRGFQNSKNFRL